MLDENRSVSGSVVPAAWSSSSVRWRSGRTWPTWARISVRAPTSWRETSPCQRSSSRSTSPSSDPSSRRHQRSRHGFTAAANRGQTSQQVTPTRWLWFVSVFWFFSGALSMKIASNGTLKEVLWCRRLNDLTVTISRRHPCTVSEVFNFCWVLFVHAKGKDTCGSFTSSSWGPPEWRQFVPLTVMMKPFMPQSGRLTLWWLMCNCITRPELFSTCPLLWHQCRNRIRPGSTEWIQMNAPESELVRDGSVQTPSLFVGNWVNWWEPALFLRAAGAFVQPPPGLFTSLLNFHFGTYERNKLGQPAWGKLQGNWFLLSPSSVLNPHVCLKFESCWDLFG